MKWNPLQSALAALTYIGIVVSFLHYIESIRHDTPDTIFDGIGALSLFTFSAAVMAFLFFYQPVALLIEGKRSDATAYLLKTLAIFGLTTIALLTLVSLQ